ncbi:ABC transporter substrate-binding protein [Actinoplanes sp. GCM10030250]|uniref:ABC transporter substrate-binding protein n=1 Tax=Actinoplanes sp. GCM10030250 TaxID=3273376 RepID=UPI003611E9A9
MKTTRTLTAVLTAGLLTLTACSSEPSAGDGVKDTTAAKGLPVAGVNLKYDPNTLVNDGKPIRLDWWAWGNVPQMQAFADAYQKIHPNVDITVVNQPWEDYWTKLPLQLQGTKGPAIFNVHNSEHDNIIKYMAPYDVPLDQLTADYTNVKSHVIDGKVYYVDLGLMSGAIYYNKDMWTTAGLTDADIPQTWDQFREVAKKLTLRDGSKLKQAGFNFNASFSAFQSGLAYQLGQNMFAADGKTPTVDNAANMQVIQRFLQMYGDGSGSKDFGTEATTSFGQGQTAMVYAWGWYEGTLRNDFPKIKFGVFRTPVPTAGATPYAFDRYNGESTIGINKNAPADQQAAAQDFLKFYLTDKAGMKALNLSYGVFPAYKPLADDPEIKADPALQAYGDIERYIWPGTIPSTFEDNFTKMWQDILYNKVDPAKALTAAQQKIATDLKTKNFQSAEQSYAGYAPSK